MDKLVYIDVKFIHFCPWNPTRRTQLKGNSRLKKLIASLREFGQVIPGILIPHPDIAGEYICLEGNRRLTAILLFNSELPADERLKFKAIVKEYPPKAMRRLYGGLNGTQAPHKITELMSSWISDKTSVQDDSKSGAFQAVVDHIGITYFKKLEKHNRSINVYNMAMAVVGPLKLDNDVETVRMFIDWMLEYPVGGTVRTAIAIGGMEAKLVEISSKGGIPWIDDNFKLKVEYPDDDGGKKLKLAQ
jgi:hypothetical protein